MCGGSRRIGLWRAAQFVVQVGAFGSTPWLRGRRRGSQGAATLGAAPHLDHAGEDRITG